MIAQIENMAAKIVSEPDSRGLLGVSSEGVLVSSSSEFSSWISSGITSSRGLTTGGSPTSARGFGTSCLASQPVAESLVFVEVSGFSGGCNRVDTCLIVGCLLWFRSSRVLVFSFSSLGSLRG